MRNIFFREESLRFSCSLGVSAQTYPSKTITLVANPARLYDFPKI